MAHTFRLSDGTDTVDLIYVSGSQEDYRLEEVESRGRGDILPIVQPADASDSGPEPIRINRPNREWRCKIQVWSSGRDDQHNNFHSFQRMFSQAGDARTWSPVDKVYLEIQLDSATNWTRYDVKYCYTTDDSGIFGVLSAKSGVTEPVAPIDATVVTEPIGYGAMETLKNYLKTPHFEEDSAGLAHNWTETGTPVTTVDTDVYLCGSQSQKVITDAAGTDGIIADTVTIGAGDYVVARVWIHHDSGDKVTMALLSGATIDSTDTDATADATATGKGGLGKTWSRYDLAGIGEQGTLTVQLKVERLAGDAAAATTYYVDKCYIGVADNLLDNNGFETAGAGGADVWTEWTETAGDGALINEAVNQHWGNDAAKITAGATLNTNVMQAVTVETDKDYTLRFWTRGDGTYDGAYQIYDATNGANIQAPTGTGVTGTTYAEVTCAFTPASYPAPCTTVNIYLWCPSTAAGIAYFDDVCVHRALTLPLAWSSFYDITNHYDSDAAHINYIDVEDIPGDQPAIMRLEQTDDGTWGTLPKAYFLGLHDSDPGAPGTYFKDFAGAGAGDRQYAVTAVDDTWTYIGAANLQLDGKYEARGEYVALVAINDQDTAAGQIKARMNWSNSAIDYIETEAVTLATFQNWTLEAVGPINMMWPTYTESLEHTAAVSIFAKHDANTANVWLDFVGLIPVHGGFSISRMDSANGLTLLRVHFDGMDLEMGDRWYIDRPGSYVENLGVPQGSYPRLRPNKHQRLHVLVREEVAAGDFHSTDLGAFGMFQIVYRPRTLTLLGTT